MKIKTAEEILKKWEFYQHIDNNSDMIKAMKEYATQFIDYASENIQINYTRTLYSTSEKYDERDADTIHVYIPNEEFYKIKELMK